MDPKTSQKGNTALMKAAAGGHKEVVEELVRAKTDVNLADEDGSGLGQGWGKESLGLGVCEFGGLTGFVVQLIGLSCSGIFEILLPFLLTSLSKTV